MLVQGTQRAQRGVSHAELCVQVRTCSKASVLDGCRTIERDARALWRRRRLPKLLALLEQDLRDMPARVLRSLGEWMHGQHDCFFAFMCMWVVHTHTP